MFTWRQQSVGPVDCRVTEVTYDGLAMNVQTICPFKKTGGMFEVHRKLAPREQLDGVQDLLEKNPGSVVSRDGEMVALLPSEEAARRFLDLKASKQGVAGQGMLDKVKSFALPEGMKVNCAPEYLRFRAWSLAGSVISGGLGFLMGQLSAQAALAAFGVDDQAGARANWAAFTYGCIGKVTQFGASTLSKVGDSDPKRAFATSSLIATANTTAALALLAVAPRSLFPLQCALQVTGTVAGIVGGAAGINIFNHLAQGPNKGEVSCKNANQDMLASCMGMPMGVALSAAGKALGLHAGVLGAGVLGPALMFCNLQAARSLRMETLDRQALQGIVDHYIDHGELPEAEKPGLWTSIKEIFHKPKAPGSEGIEFVQESGALLGSQAQELFQLYRDEKYLLSCDGQKVRILCRTGAGLDDLARATLQARLVERALAAGKPADLHLLESSYLAARSFKPSEELVAHGWHTSVAGLGVPLVDMQWTGAAAAEPAPMSIRQFLEGIGPSKPDLENPS